jgi:hypothetical protein
MRRGLLGVVVGLMLVAPTAANANAQLPLYWTIKVGQFLPTDPPFPVLHQHCDPMACVGTLGKIQGHSYQWLIGRSPVWKLQSIHFHAKLSA